MSGICALSESGGGGEGGERGVFSMGAMGVEERQRGTRTPEGKRVHRAQSKGKGVQLTLGEARPGNANEGGSGSQPATALVITLSLRLPELGKTSYFGAEVCFPNKINLQLLS